MSLRLPCRLKEKLYVHADCDEAEMDDVPMSIGWSRLNKAYGASPDGAIDAGSMMMMKFAKNIMSRSRLY